MPSTIGSGNSSLQALLETLLCNKALVYQLAVANPGAAAWYCGLKWEMAVYLAMHALTEALQVPSTPGLDNAKARMAQHLHGIVGMNIDVE